MTSSNTLKKLVSIGAAMLLAVGGSLVAAEPASAAVFTDVRFPTPSPPNTQLAYFNLEAASCTQSYSTTSSSAELISYFTVTVQPAGGSATTVTPSNVTASGSYIVVTLPSLLVGGDTLTVMYTDPNSSKSIKCSSGSNQVGSFGPITYSLPIPASITGTPAISSASGTVTATPASAVGGTPSKYWFVCDSAKSATSASLSGAPIDGISGCAMLFNSAGTQSAVNTTTLSLTGTFYVRAGSQGSYTYPAATFAGKQVLFAQVLGSLIAYSASVSGDVTVTPPTTPTVIPESAKPLPVWAAPILKAIPTLSKTLDTSGGKVSLTDGDFSSLKSVTVGGQAVVYSMDAKGDVNIPIPAGKAGTTADLVVTFTGGKMTIQDGIKYVAPTDVAAVREAPIAGFAKNSTKINFALAESIQYAAQLDKKANTVLCTGYAASQAAVATATARAEAACGYATKVNELLVNKKVSIVVNAKLAKKAAVGIKVYH